MRSEKLVLVARDISGNPEEGEYQPLKAATKQRLVKTEKTICAIVKVIFGVNNSETDVLASLNFQ
jgi:hypothetical protein